MQYELVVILKVEDEKTAAARFDKALEKAGFQIQNFESWGKKKLSYPIKKQTEGLYLAYVLSSETAKPQTLEQQFKLDESILRTLVLKKEAPRKEKTKKKA